MHKHSDLANCDGLLSRMCESCSPQDRSANTAMPRGARGQKRNRTLQTAMDCSCFGRSSPLTLSLPACATPAAPKTSEHKHGQVSLMPIATHSFCFTDDGRQSFPPPTSPYLCAYADALYRKGSHGENLSNIFFPSSRNCRYRGFSLYRFIINNLVE